MTRVVLALILLASACTPATATPSATATATATSAPVTAAVAPTTAPTVPPAQLPEVAAPQVVVTAGTFPILTSLRLRLAVIDEQVQNAARFGVERYLQSIDYYRNGQSPALPITGAFLAAVSTALKDSATPGVKRQFQIESLTVDRHVQKPWGTHAYVDVTVTLVDHAIEGSAPDQRETGKLRLAGDKMFVTDGWDFDHDRWFNGFGALPLEQVRTGVAEAVKNYLWFESWTAGTTPAGITNGADTVFQRARAARLNALDRRQIVSSLFEGVTATIERFETIDGIWSGIATARLNGTLVTTNTAGQTKRAAFEREVRAFVLGNWSPEVVDEQTGTGDWASGGELALDQIDVNRA